MLRNRLLLELYAFYFACYKVNGIVEVCTLNALSNANSHMGSNLSLLRSKYRINFQSHSSAHCIKLTTIVEQL